METPWYFNPIMFEIGPIKAHWYGFMYALGFTIGYIYLAKSKKWSKILNLAERDAMVLFVILGVLLGGRIGYILFYNLNYYLTNPGKLLAVWEGGMSFHGGLIGVAIAILIYMKKYKHNFLTIGDAICSIAPVGLFFAKIGNFINAELYGRITTYYCLYFPTDPTNCRYPSQLLEAFLEGIILLIIVQIVGKKSSQRGMIATSFLFFYGVFRIFIEFFRQPDPQIGFIFGFITEGQLLSSLMIIASIYMLFYAKKKKSVYPKLSE